jgi:hypothetical protein
MRFELFFVEPVITGMVQIVQAIEDVNTNQDK